jgi:hypothetical protein
VLSSAEGWCHLDVAGTAAANVLLCGLGEQRCRVEVQADVGTQLQLSLIRLPADLPRLGLRVEENAEGACVLRLRALDAAVWLEEAAWERSVPGSDGRAPTSWAAGKPAGQSAQEWFGQAPLRPGETRTSIPVELPAGRGAGPVLFKVTGRDALGRRVTGWTVVE